MEKIKREIKTTEDYKFLETELKPTPYILNGISHFFQIGEDIIGLMWVLSSKTMKVEGVLFKKSENDKFKLVVNDEEYYIKKYLHKKTIWLNRFQARSINDILTMLKRKRSENKKVYYLGEKTYD